MALSNTTTTGGDPLIDAAALLPLHPTFIDDDPEPVTVPRPFGLRFAIRPPHPVVIDLSAVRYDTERQLCVDGDGLAVFGRHTDGQTSTQTSDGYKSMDSDTDHRED